MGLPCEPLLHGHLAYAVAPPEALVMLPNERLMHVDAAHAFLDMAHAARRDGIDLIPRMPFRSLRRQERTVAHFAARPGFDAARAHRRAAPPGYSEHHTGYAVDVCDPPAATRAQRGIFSGRPAFSWMRTHAAAFGFEMSFPEANPFGIDFEPWHWRWVGDDRAQRIFATARQLRTMAEQDPRIAALLPGADSATLLAAAPAEQRGPLETLLRQHCHSLAEVRPR